ncbi:MAG: lysophospholipid acyltransferase family protein [Acidobacteria bacterium]|nr:lysophospholipid acyltransferase family protein [Acidobacteriota bacterium]
MQDRMQSGSRALDLLYGAVFGTLFPLFLFAARTFARRSRGYDIADNIIAGFIRCRPKYLDAVRANVAQVLGIPPRSPEAERTALRIMKNHAYAWVDFFYFGQRPLEEAAEAFAEVSGEEYLHQALGEGRGAILLTAHAGNFELGGLLLRLRDLKVHAVYKPDRFAAVERLRDRIRSQGGVVGIPVGGSGFATLPLVGLLREGKLVGMQGDRDFNLTGLPHPFFGRQAYFPRGPWELSAMTGAPVIPCFFFTDEDGRFRVRFFEPRRVDGDRQTRAASIQQGLRAYAQLLEDLVREHPDQWYCFYPFWDDPLRQAPPEG